MKFGHIPHNPLVSVMMPARNAAAYVAETLKSVQRQTHDNWELIFVDDGSTDDTLKTAFEFAQHDARIRVFAVPHCGRGAARNECLKHVRGDLIAVCDADDVSFPDRFAQQIDYLRSHRDVGAVASRWISFVDLPPTSFTQSRVEGASTEETIAGLSAGKMRLHNATVMMRTDVVRRFGGYRPELRRAQDYEFFSRLWRAGVTLAVIPTPLLYYRQASAIPSRPYFCESNLYIRYADQLLNGSDASFADFAKSLSGLQWKLFYHVKYTYFWLKSSVSKRVREKAG